MADLIAWDRDPIAFSSRPGPDWLDRYPADTVKVPQTFDRTNYRPAEDPPSTMGQTPMAGRGRGTEPLRSQ